MATQLQTSRPAPTRLSQRKLPQRHVEVRFFAIRSTALLSSSSLDLRFPSPYLRTYGQASGKSSRRLSTRSSKIRRVASDGVTPTYLGKIQHGHHQAIASSQMGKTAHPRLGMQVHNAVWSSCALSTGARAKPFRRRTWEQQLLKDTPAPKATQFFAEACSSFHAVGWNIGLRCRLETSLDVAHEPCPHHPREPPRARRGRLPASAKWMKFPAFVTTASQRYELGQVLELLLEERRRAGILMMIIVVTTTTTIIIIIVFPSLSP